MSDPSPEADPGAPFASDRITWLRPNRLLALSPAAALVGPLLFVAAL